VFEAVPTLERDASSDATTSKNAALVLKPFGVNFTSSSRLPLIGLYSYGVPLNATIVGAAVLAPYVTVANNCCVPAPMLLAGVDGAVGLADVFDKNKLNVPTWKLPLARVLKIEIAPILIGPLNNVDE